MKRYIDSVSLSVGRVKMSRDCYKGVFVAVEGEADRKVYSHLLNHKTAQLLVLDGKTNVLTFLTKLRADNKVCGIVDNDYWPVTTGKPAHLSSLFVTDTHDIETLIIRSDAFQKVIANFCDEKWLGDFLASRKAEDLRQVLIAEAAKIGALRLTNALKNADLRFTHLDFDKLLAGEDCELNVDALYAQVVEHSSVRISKETLRNWVNQCSTANEADPWILVTGHDVVGVLVVALKKRLGRTAFNRTELEGMLRLAFDVRHFRETRLCKDLTRWADSIDVPDMLQN